VHILWARHGQNAANLSHTLSYRVFDGDLTDEGRQQAQLLADRLNAERGDPVGYIACSPLRRARQTAEIIGARLRLPVTVGGSDLRELNVGDLDGRSDAAAWEVYSQVLAAWRAGDGQARFPGGEDWHTLCARLQRALTMVACESGGANSLVVAHGGSIRAAIPGLTGDPVPASDLPNCAVATLLAAGGPGSRLKLLHWPAAPDGHT
jgi:broad specificity phosphatase PhoE